MLVDLHTHTKCSDGSLAPAELLDRAVIAGVQMLSITDHDTTDAYYDDVVKLHTRIHIIPGVEFSAQWRERSVHVLGLNITLDNCDICSGISRQHIARIERSRHIAERLLKAGFEDTLNSARKIAGHDQVTRTHFAHALVQMGVVNDLMQAFKKYLGAGKMGDVKTDWAPLHEIVEWIRSANGVAVIAHPAKYKLTKTKLKSLVSDFKLSGGQGLEVVSGKQTPDITQHLAKLCEQYKMLASVGSDFHQPGQSWAELGNIPTLPKTCKPVWDNW